MSAKLSQRQVGKRLAELRKIKGFTQVDLAKTVKISRPSLAQIELGNRGVDILELQKLSQALSFSLDSFVSSDFTIDQNLPFNFEKNKKKQERISIPSLQVNKFRNVFLYILERCAGKPNVDETFLHKLLYFSDFNYYELYEEHLTGSKYKKLANGPVSQQLGAILSQMVKKGQIQRVKTLFRGLPKFRYLPLQKADLTEFLASEKQVIDNVIEQMSDWSTYAIKRYILKDMPLAATKDGDEINYELVFYREAPFSVRNYCEEMDG